MRFPSGQLCAWHTLQDWKGTESCGPPCLVTGHCVCTPWIVGSHATLLPQPHASTQHWPGTPIPQPLLPWDPQHLFPVSPRARNHSPVSAELWPALAQESLPSSSDHPKTSGGCGDPKVIGSPRCRALCRSHTRALLGCGHRGSRACAGSSSEQGCAETDPRKGRGKRKGRMAAWLCSGFHFLISLC